MILIIIEEMGPQIKENQNREGGFMMDYSSGNKRAWEYNAYEFWLKEEGPPSKKAERLPISAVPAERRRFPWPCWERK